MTDNTHMFVIMFADVSGSTRLYEQLGDKAAQEAIGACVSTMMGIIQRHGGVVIKTIGDEVMCRFDSPDAAVSSACDIQDAMENDTSASKVKLSVRIGLHYGPALLQENDVFGDAVNTAARMAGIAKATQIITTGDTVERLSAQLAEKTRVFDRAHVKGKQSELVIHEVVWEEEDVTRMATAVQPIIAPDDVTPLKLLYLDNEREIPADSPAFVFGRGDQCDIKVDTGVASRMHARIEYRRGKYILVDQSTNGTFVRTEDGKDVYLRREELPLWGVGIISLGQEISEQTPHLIHFKT